MPITTILFDAYGTLFDTGRGSIEATEQILKKRHTNIDANLFYSRWKTLHNRLTQEQPSFVTEERIFLLGLSKLYEEHGIVGSASEDVEIMLQTLGRRSAYPEINAVLARLKPHYRIYIASTSDHRPLMDDIVRNGVAVDRVFSSESLQSYKPQRRFYTDILQQAGAHPSETLFVGDSLVDDVRGPQSVGMKAVWVNRKGRDAEDVSPDFTIENLNGLFAVLGETLV
ncbi:MAG: haloacid dehalogenase type [Paenibacillus sp.]|nr:haloacid dehalogenase type [Paenibacillus sp.]